MQELLDRRDMALNPQLTVFEDIVKREPYSVEEKAEEIVQRVKLAGITRFLLLFKGSPQPQRAGGYLYGGAGAV